MLKLYISALSVIFICSISYAAPTKKESALFVADLEKAVKSSNKALASGSTFTLHNQSKLFSELRNKAKEMFTPGGPVGGCDFAASSAQALWLERLRNFQRPGKQDAAFIKQREDDFRDNLQVCKDQVKALQ
jgi:hypothetical protein